MNKYCYEIPIQYTITATGTAIPAGGVYMINFRRMLSEKIASISSTDLVSFTDAAFMALNQPLFRYSNK